MWYVPEGSAPCRGLHVLESIAVKEHDKTSSPGV